MTQQLSSNATLHNSPAMAEPQVHEEDGDHLGEAEGDNPAATTSRSTSSWVGMVCLSILLGAVLSAPQWQWMLEHWNDPTTPVPMGVVQRLHFIGNLGIHTQIDTRLGAQEHSFIVGGVSKLEPGMRIEQRKTLGGLQLCEVGSEPAHCEDRLWYR